MSTTITFESATIIDAVRKAAQIAPGKAGVAFDKAAGLLLQITPNEDVHCLIRATNLDIFYSEVIGSIGESGEDTVWRLPARLLNEIIGTLNIKSGNTITFTQNGNQVHVSSGRMRAKFNLMDAGYYPDWEMFDELGMNTVQNLGAKIAMVEWAAASGSPPPFGGIYLDGEYVVATDRYKLVRVPLLADIPSPIVVPIGLGAHMRQLGETQMKVSGNQLQLMPDPYTQVSAVLYDSTYPAVASVMRDDYPELIEVHKAHLIDVINRATKMAGADRMPIVDLYIGKGEVAAFLENAEQGLVGDVVEIPGQADHPRIKLRFTPDYLTTSLSKAPNDRVKLGYDPSNTERIVYIDGGSGYQAWVIPRRDAQAT
jgi:DNA polymerase III sliding clamp (beta) subunit (PCNA family)